MNLIQIKNGSVLFGHPPLIDSADLSIKQGERVCLVGRNGSGKSSLLSILEGKNKLDGGQRIVPSDIVISLLPQDPPRHISQDIFDFVAEGLDDVSELLKEYFHLTLEIAKGANSTNLKRLESLQEELDSRNAWHYEQRINNILTQLSLDGTAKLTDLSGGWRRKAALAKSLVCQPDILLLDEPTNHLDIDMVVWLEKTLLNYQGAIVFVSHDRAFIRKMATRIIDIDRGKLVSYPGQYDKYLNQKAHDLEVESVHNKQFDKKLAQEEAWIREGIKARRTRNEGRVRALKALRTERQARRTEVGKASISHNMSTESGKRVFELKGISYQVGKNCLVNRFSLMVSKGDKIALIGPNGCGKTTLIKLMLGELNESEGTIERGTNLNVAYFDQHRDQLSLDKSIIDVIADGKREISINGSTRHVIGYLQDYLFSPDRVNAPVSTLSGGEKNRLMLAKLMLKPSNVLILDEPTNDLDVETLELLESLIVEYEGTVLMVSHDREFVNNVATSSVVFEGNGVLREFIGGYDDCKKWYDARKSSLIDNHQESEISTNKKAKPTSTNKAKKLSYNEKRELDSLPKTIDALENDIKLLQLKINSVDFFQQPTETTQPVLDELALKESELQTSYERWDELESKFA